MALDSFHKTLFQNILHLYNQKKFCDVKILLHEDSFSSRLKPIFCHSLVLCSVAPSLKKFLADPDVEKDGDDYKVVLIPDLPYDMVHKFVDEVYSGLCSNEFLLDINLELAQVLGMLSSEEESVIEEHQLEETVVVEDPHMEMDTNEIEMAVLDDSTLPLIAFDQGELKDLLAKGGKIVDKVHQSTPIWSTPGPKSSPAKSGFSASGPGDGFTTSTPGPASRKRAAIARRKAQAEVTQICPITTIPDHLLPQVPIPQPARVLQGPMRYNPKLSMNKPSFSKLESLQFGMCRHQGRFRAKTDSYYATSKIVSDKENVIVIDGVARQFRMKLPEKEFVALLSVGVREGENVVSVLACTAPGWFAQATFVNLIGMAKNVCGTSFGAILRHPRCSESHQDKMSRESVEKFKNEYKRLANVELNKMAAEHKKLLYEFDTDVSQLEFHHLPQKPILMEFNLVSDIEREEIMDYAILSGNKPNDLTIQTFINFNYQKFPAMRLVTIFCDTIACFLGLGNSTPLSQCPALKDSFENYANRTCQYLALQELGATGIMEPGLNTSINSANNSQHFPSLRAVFSSPALQSYSTAESGPNELQVVQKVPERVNTNVQVPGEKFVEKRFKCTVESCFRTFISESHRSKHLARLHVDPAEGSNKICPPCGKVLNGNKELRAHIHYHHTPKECTECNLQFPGAYLFYHHNNMKHITLQTCEICGKTGFKGKQKLISHKINKHMEDHEKPFVCEVCGKGYAHKSKLQSHQMNVHIRTRPFKCRLEGCNADFNELANRNAHERNVHKFDFRKTMSHLKEYRTVSQERPA